MESEGIVGEGEEGSFEVDCPADEEELELEGCCCWVCGGVAGGVEGGVVFFLSYTLTRGGEEGDPRVEALGFCVGVPAEHEPASGGESFGVVVAAVVAGVVEGFVAEDAGVDLEAEGGWEVEEAEAERLVRLDG